jgi:hypothetical protein
MEPAISRLSFYFSEGLSGLIHCTKPGQYTPAPTESEAEHHIYCHRCGVQIRMQREYHRSPSSLSSSVPLLTDDSQIGADVRVIADEDDRANFDQHR